MDLQHVDSDSLINLKGKTVLQVIPTLETGGAERTAVDMVGGIVAAGGRALVASAGGKLVPTIEKLGGEHITLPLDARLRLDQMILNRYRLKKLCAIQKADLIHARSRAPAFAALSAARAIHIPFITTYHGIYSEKNAFKRWYNSVMVAGDAVIANSNYTANVIKQRYPIEPSKIYVVHRGCDTDLFDQKRISPDDQSALRQKWHIPEDRPVVMLLARLTEWKGHLLAIKAAEHLRKKTGRLPFFVFAGSTESETYAARVRSAILEARLIHDFAVVGHVDNAPLALSLADVVIVPSTKPEAFGRSVAEASAMGRPVIAFDHGGATETIAASTDTADPSTTGLRVPVGDSETLADGIHQILELSPKERQQMGTRGRDFIATHFSKQQMIQKTLAVYQHILHHYRP